MDGRSVVRLGRAVGWVHVAGWAAAHALFEVVEVSRSLWRARVEGVDYGCGALVAAVGVGRRLGAARSVGRLGDGVLLLPAVVVFVRLAVPRREGLAGRLVVVVRRGRVAPSRRRRRVFVIGMRMLVVVLLRRRRVRVMAVRVMLRRRGAWVASRVRHAGRLAVVPIVVGVPSHRHGVGIVVTTVRRASSLGSRWRRRSAFSRCLRFVVFQFPPLLEIALWGILCWCGCTWHGVSTNAKEAVNEFVCMPKNEE